MRIKGDTLKLNVLKNNIIYVLENQALMIDDFTVSAKSCENSNEEMRVRKSD